jgi:hypothetical protein
MAFLNELLEKIDISVRSAETVLHGHKINNSSKNFNKTLVQERNDNEEVFFNSIFNNETKIPTQINIKKESYLPLYTPQSIRDSQQLKNLINFFIHEPHINIYNFPKAELLLNKFVDFKSLTDLEELKNKLLDLQQELDKSTASQDKFGKAIITWSMKQNGVKLTLMRPKLQGFKQFIAIDFTQESTISVLNCWTGKTHKHEYIKKRTQNKTHKKHQRNSILFDAEVWKSFNSFDIVLKNYRKTLECLERNRNTLPELIQEINKKNLLQVIQEPYLNKVTIKTDNHETAFLSFITRSFQKVDVKLCNYASSITIG